jgi:hypothetical protein
MEQASLEFHTLSGLLTASKIDDEIQLRALRIAYLLVAGGIASTRHICVRNKYLPVVAY